MVSFYYTAFQSNYLILGQIESDRLPIAERSNATLSVRTSLCVLNLEDFEKIKRFYEAPNFIKIKRLIYNEDGLIIVFG